jgi:cytidylate kinase
MMKARLTIAMDGPAGSGKSTIAQRLAEKLDYLYLNSGSMYRAMTLLSIREGGDSMNVPMLTKLAKNCRIDFSNNGKTTLLNGEDVSESLRTPEIDRAIVNIAKVPEVRHEMVKQQRRIGENGGIIVEGRDVTTVVFPDADLKFYINASVEERAKRRFTEQEAKGIQTTLEQVEQEIRERDQMDESREHSPLRTAEDAIVLDTTGMTINQAVDFVLNRVEVG